MHIDMHPVYALYFMYFEKQLNSPCYEKTNQQRVPTKIAVGVRLTTCNPQRIDTRTVPVQGTYYQYT